MEGLEGLGVHLAVSRSVKGRPVHGSIDLVWRRTERV